MSALYPDAHPPPPPVTQLSFDSEALIPRRWRKGYAARQVFVFNPSLAWVGDHYIMLYRVVLDRHIMRIAACRLDDRLRLIPDSVAPFSDTIGGDIGPMGDPRLFRYAGRLLATYGSFSSPVTVKLVEIDVDGLRAAAPARPLLLEPRQTQERNWGLFEQAGELYAVYTITPHAILKLDLSQANVVPCQRVHTVPWDMTRYRRRYGELRGGAAPVQVGDAYCAFFHSPWMSTPIPRYDRWVRLRLRLARSQPLDQACQRLSNLMDAARLPAWLWDTGPWSALRTFLFERVYYGGFYRFAARPPFEPLDFVPRPILAPRHEPLRTQPGGLLPRLQVVFPGGAVRTGDGRWVVAYGLHEERCRVRVLNERDLVQQCVPAQNGA